MQSLRELRSKFSSSRAAMVQLTGTLSRTIAFVIFFLAFVVVVTFVGLPLVALFGTGLSPAFLTPSRPQC